MAKELIPIWAQLSQWGNKRRKLLHEHEVSE
ncbi:hypothetical protein [Sphingobacterium puteale]